jgi:hypothetical protein
MFFIPPDELSTEIFLGIMAAVLVTFFYGIYRANKKMGRPALLRTALVVLGTFVWLALFTFVVESGLLEKNLTPRLPLFFLFTNLVAVITALSPIGRWLATATPICYLVLFQMFRIPLEWILHFWAEQGAIPESMTWSGQNWDVVSGFFALAFFMTVKRYPKLAWIPNGVGFILLLNVMRVAVLSSPVSFAWTVSPPLLLAFHLPYAWIVPICVGGALMGHIVLTRALLQQKTPFSL